MGLFGNNWFLYFVNETVLLILRISAWNVSTKMKRLWDFWNLIRDFKEDQRDLKLLHPTVSCIHQNEKLQTP